MNIVRKFLCVTSFTLLCGVHTLHAQTLTQTTRYFNGPVVTEVSATSAVSNIAQVVQAGFIAGEREQIYFEHYKTNQVCITISPTPTECLPKKTAKGVTSVQIADLAPNTSYTVVYKKDNSIYCITAPCPDNSFTSLSMEFKTLPSTGGTNDNVDQFTRNFGHRARGSDVIRLQTLLIQRGFMQGNPTGYFGVVTLKAVKDLQRSYGINPIGFLGPLTRQALYNTVSTSVTDEYFEGTITAFSTGCYSDGECSISVDGKKIITTIGWSQQVVGSITGSATNVGDISSKIGAHAKVYAQKISDGYTLYGSKNYYIQVQ